MSETIFGKNLRFYRKKLGMTQRELGMKYDIAQVSIANYEKGTRFPGERTIIQLAEGLGISIDLLFSELKQKSRGKMAHTFQTDEFMKYLLNESLDDCLNYTRGWMKSGHYSLQDCFLKIIVPLLKETGNRWQGGSLTILEEHLISEKIREIISLISAYSRQEQQPAPTARRVWVGLCAPSDKHDMGLFMFSQLLRARGWTSYFLGPDVPVNDLTAMLKKYKPDLINISIASGLFMGGLEAYLQNLNAKSDNCPIVVSGEGFSEGKESLYEKIQYIPDLLDRGYDYAIGLEEKDV